MMFGLLDSQDYIVNMTSLLATMISFHGHAHFICGSVGSEIYSNNKFSLFYEFMLMRNWKLEVDELFLLHKLLGTR
jgi:hypothetical protein